MNIMPATGPSILFDRPEMLPVTIIGIMDTSMTTITISTTIETAIIMTRGEFVLRPPINGY